jgi:peptidoglycan/LPS O-acetylase OafA/YrhL
MRVVLVIVWAAAIGSVVANAFDLPARWRLGRYERPVMYAAVFLGGGAFWILMFTSESLATKLMLVASVVVVPLAGMMISKGLRQRGRNQLPRPQPTRSGK